jgi:methylaspartate mutase sigma subunit
VSLLTSLRESRPGVVLPNRVKSVVTTISSDCHTWNLVFLQLLLEERGHEVVNCGPCVPVEEIIVCCLRERAQLLVISTVNGHGLIEAHEYIKRIRAVPALRDIRVVLGGKLGVRGEISVAEAAELVSAGFDAVFAEGSSSVVEFSYFLGRLQTGDAELGQDTKPTITSAGHDERSD